MGQQVDVDTLRAYLTEQATFIGDGGGRRSTTRRPVVGMDRVVRFLIGIARNVTDGWHFEMVQLNHRPAMAIWDGDVLDQVVWLVVRDGLVDQVLCVRNPDKLGALLRWHGAGRSGGGVIST